MKHVLAAALAAIALSACATSQYTSGSVYNARTAAYYGTQGSDVTGYTPSADVAADIAAIADVEPNLVFPARIGIAHLDRGRLAAVPPEHLDAWTPLRERIEPRLGEVVPISPLITAMVAKPAHRGDVVNVVDDIRRGAARQHVDYVLIYETLEPRDRRKTNGLGFTDWSILGLFVLPTRDVEVEATASAVLIDVRNGYPYGTASGVTTKDGVATAYRAYDKTRDMREVASVEAVRRLADDVDAMLDQLTDRLAAQASAVAP